MFSALFAFSLVPSIAAAGFQPVVTEASSELLVLEQTLLRAMAEKDEATLDRLLADDYVLRGNPDVDRSTWLSNALALCWGERFSLADEWVVDLGNTAVVGLTLTFYRDPATCEPAVLRSLVTDVWVRHTRGWHLAVRTSGPLGPGGLEAQFEVVDLPPVLEARGELSFVATGGNASTETVGVSAEATYRSGPGTTTGRGRFVTSEAGGVERARSTFLQARYGRHVFDRLDVFGRAGYLRDRFAGLEHRMEADAGVSVSVRGQPHALTVDAGLGMTSETRLEAPDERFVTGTTGTAYAWTLSPTTTLGAEMAIVADLGDTSNWRLSSDLSLLAGLGRFLSARFSYGVRHVNTPIPGFGRSDRTVSAALVVGYARRALP